MFDNLLYQNAAQLLSQDILNKRMPGAILLSGPVSSGKLTCALEIARVLSCTGDGKNPKGHWLCECSSCKKNKELVNQSVIIAGPRDCLLEMLAAKKAFLQAAYNNSRYLIAARYLFIRSVRKLTNRFNQILWEEDDKISKIAPLTQEIDEELEKINPAQPLPDNDVLEKVVTNIVELSTKLEASFMYDSLPINQIRKAASWAHLKSVEGKKVFIIENAERMLDSSRNALLKILEEPPEDVVFILTTSNRGAVMPTILSRVRTYSFSERSQKQQSEVIERVFHASSEEYKSVDDYLQTFLPVTPQQIKSIADNYFSLLMNGKITAASVVSKQCNDFEPKILLKLFLTGILESVRKESPDSKNLKACEKVIEFTRNCYNNVTIYNQSTVSALENLTRDLSSIKKIY